MRYLAHLLFLTIASLVLFGCDPSREARVSQSETKGTVPRTGAAEAPSSVFLDELIRVTITAKDEGKIGVYPIGSPSIDIVNLGGKTLQSSEQTSLIFECLPGAVVLLHVDDEDDSSDGWGFLPLSVEDDAKELTLSWDSGILFANGVARYWSVNRFLKALSSLSSEEEVRRFQQRLLKSVHGGTSVSDGIVSFSLRSQNKRFDDEKYANWLIEVLGSLRNTDRGCGILVDVENPADLPKGLLSESLLKAIADIQPRRLLITTGMFSEFKDGLRDLEVLGLVSNTGQDIPDLSKFPKLQHLVLVGPSDRSLDLQSVGQLGQLKSLTVLSQGKIGNMKSITELSNLQFLALLAEQPVMTAGFERLTRLRYLAAPFLPGTDFSFVKELPQLQTLCIANMTERHNLEPLVDWARIRCLALDKFGDYGAGGKEQEFENVTTFKRQRRDIEVVPYAPFDIVIPIPLFF